MITQSQLCSGGSHPCLQLYPGSVSCFACYQHRQGLGKGLQTLSSAKRQPANRVAASSQVSSSSSLLHGHFLHLPSFPESSTLLVRPPPPLNSPCFCWQLPERERHHGAGCTRPPWHRETLLGSQPPRGPPAACLDHQLSTNSTQVLDITEVHKTWTLKLNHPGKDVEQDPLPVSEPGPGMAGATDRLPHVSYSPSVSNARWEPSMETR